MLANLATATEDEAFAIDFEGAVARLPAAARKVFVLHDVEGYKHREIGKLIGITDGTSKGQLRKPTMRFSAWCNTTAKISPRAASAGRT